MPICSPPNSPTLAPGFFRRSLLLASLLFSALSTANAQTLARPGWAGSGLTPEAWWRHAVVYRIDTTPLPSLAQLPSLQAFGIDAVILTPESMQPPATALAADSTDTANAPLSLDDFLFQCSRLHIRVLVPLDLAPADANPSNTMALARSWLYRGAAGFVVSGIEQLTATNPATPVAQPSVTPIHLRHHATPLHVAAPEPAILTSLHNLVSQFPGQRILVGAAAANALATSSLQLQIETLSTASADQPHIASRIAGLGAQTSPRALIALATLPSAMTPIDATLLLATDQPAILDSSLISTGMLAKVFPPLPPGTVPPSAAKVAPPPPPPADVYGAFKPYVPKDTNSAAERKRKAAAEKAEQEAENIAFDTFPVQPMYQPISNTPEGFVAFYSRLIQLHRSNPALREGTLHALDTGSQPALAWSALRSGSPPLIVACNPTGTALKLDLAPDLIHLNIGRYMSRTLLHTAAASGVESINAISVPPHGVYIGELQGGYTYR